MKKVRDGYKMTELGEIPNEWKIKKLGEIAIGKGEYGIGASASEYIEGKPRYLRITDIGDGCKLLFNDIKGLDEKEYEKYILKEGDIVFARTGNTTGKGYVYNKEHGELVYAGFLIKYSVDNNIANHNFIKYVIQSKRYWDWVNIMSTRSGQPGINSNEYSSFIIQLPPLEEQEKIASILSTVDEQIDNVDAIIEKNKELKKGLMQTLLTKGIGHTKFKKTEIGEIPEEWTLVKIGDVAKFQAGYAFKSSDYVDNGVKLVKITNVQQKDLLWNDTDFLPEEFLNKYKEYSLEINDVIIAMTRPIISSGIKICKVKKEDTPALLNQRVGRFITSENVNNKYLYQYCFSNYFINKVNELCSTTGQPNISSNQLESIMISLPSTEEQEKIGSILLNVDEKMEEYENKKQRLEELKKGLMQQLLTGNIRII